MTGSMSPGVLKLLTPATGLLVTVEEVKLQLRIDHTEQDSLLAAYIKAATEQAEARMRRALLTQTWDWLLDEFPCGQALRLPLTPVQSITHVKYYDEADVQQTWSSANYQVEAAALRPRLAPVVNVEWPATYARMQAVEIRIVAGHGNAAAVPASIRHWIAAAVGEAYKSPEITTDRQNPEVLSRFVDGLLDRYTVPFL